MRRNDSLIQNLLSLFLSGFLLLKIWEFNNVSAERATYQLLVVISTV